jgi:DNA-directed RNA polymerase specialized sigma24 family protein
LVHISLDAQPDGEPCLLDQLAAPEAEPAISEAMNGLGLTVLEGLSLRAAAERLEISAMSVQRAQKKALAALRRRPTVDASTPLLRLAGCPG